jgi:hypothetical protein
VLFPNGSDDNAMVPSAGPHYVDDSSCCIAISDANTLLATAGNVGKMFIEAAHTHGFRANLEPGKSHFLFAIHGASSTKVKQKVYGSARPVVTIDTRSRGTLDIDILSASKFVGTMHTHLCTLDNEAKYRSDQCTAALCEIRPLVSSRRLLPCAKRLLVVSKAFSRLFYCASSWVSLSQAATCRLATQYMKGLRMATGTLSHAKLVVTNCQVLSKASMPKFDIYACYLRLRYFIRFVLHAPHSLKILVQHEFEVMQKDSWLNQVHEDLHKAGEFFGAMTPTSHPSAAPGDWLCFLISETTIASNMIAKLLEMPVGTSDEADSLQCIFPCRLCSWAGDSMHQLAGHSWARHKVRNPIHAHVPDNLCRNCGMHFHYRLDIIRHLTRNLDCYTSYIDNMPILEHSVIKELDLVLASEDRTVRKSGRSALGMKPQAVRDPQYQLPVWSSRAESV